ncbi:MAG: cytochrome b/b6 domain-containing protein [Acidobacteria bacterium]|nr:cytochrome b/b6 domain-containing protein [Acidobacteriota bacterium]
MTTAAAARLGVGVLFLLWLPSAVAQKPSNDDCLACHGDSSLSKEVEGKPVSLFVNPDKFTHSLHGGMFTCVDCHTDIKTSPHENPPAKVSCATCHSDAQAAYERGFHAKAKAGGTAPRAVCTDCHGSPHELLPASDPQSRTNHANIPATCGTCHSQKFVMEANGGSTQPFMAYQESVHGRAVAHGVEKAAVCTDCHGAHEVLTAADPKSPIFKFNVPQTCGRCHEAVQKEFQSSIHGQAIAQGQGQAPVCTDCHGIHAIKSHNDPSSPVAAQNLAQNTCARCHEGVRLSQEFGFEGARVSTYLASYHGLASKRGSAVVANCASCHGVHNILPSSDPRSSIAPANLVKTCGQCHRGVTEKFVAAKVHVNAPLSGDAGSIAVRWVRRLYVPLILLVIGGMFVHNFILWRFKAIRHRQHAGPRVTRMDRGQRTQHAVLFSSFFVLVITGFALKYPDSVFYYLSLGINENLRSLIHRLAGLALIGAGAYHGFYILFQGEGRRMLRDMWPSATDLAGLWENLQYHLGRAPQKPAFGRFNYAEKAEYWALVWGTLVMAATGIMLWAKVIVGNLMPRWWLDVATAIHFYEAILATLAILVWHFYQVFFDPDVYPMNWAWWDGKMPLHHYEEEHALDSETLQSVHREPIAAEAPENAPPAPPDPPGRPESGEEKP